MANIITITASVKMDEAAINRELKSPDGVVGRYGQGKANAITQKARQLAPVGETGALRNSIRSRTIRNGDELAWQISAGVDYAIHIIEGRNGNRRPNNFIGDAVAAVFGSS